MAVGIEKPTRVRFVILALISFAVMTNYLDRAVIGLATPDIAAEFKLSPIALGVLFSAFSWTYFAMQVPGGAVLDRFGARIVYLVAAIGWSFSTVMHATATGFFSLFGWRLSLGFFEAPCFPGNSNIVGSWFPQSERARAIGVYTAAEYVSLGFITPFLIWLLTSFGWRSLFIFSGAMGAILVLAWWVGYHDPVNSKRANKAELDLIREGGGRPTTGGLQFSWPLLRQLAGHPQIIALCIGQFAVYSTFTFFLTWFPTYLVSARHMGWIQIGYYASLPYIAGFFGILFAGWFSDFLLRRGASLNLARKFPVVAGLVGASVIVLANYVASDVMVIAIFSIAFFAQAMSSSGWSVLSEIAPEGTLGLIGGLFGAAANLSGIVTPLVVGIIYQETGSFVMALAFVGGVAAVGAAAWIFFIGDLKPISMARVPAIDKSLQ